MNELKRISKKEFKKKLSQNGKFYMYYVEHWSFVNIMRKIFKTSFSVRSKKISILNQSLNEYMNCSYFLKSVCRVWYKVAG